MAATLRLSAKGLQIVDQTRKKKGWAKTASAWSEMAITSEATLKRFWQRAPVQHETFVNICKVVGVQWEDVAEESTALVVAPETESSWGERPQECLALIKQGVSVWNQWWQTNCQVKADLAGVELRGSDLKGIDLRGANLKDADLSGVNLSNALLCRADLTGANLSRADLSHVDLSRADLSGANLSRADLSHSLLVATQALGTNFTEAKFTGVCLEDWNINSSTTLNIIVCDYVYLKSNQLERRPSNGKFAPEEFTALFQKFIETIDLIFTGGVDLRAFFPAFQDLQVEYGEENLSIQSIEKKSNGAFVVRLKVPPKADKAGIEVHLKELYEAQLKSIKAKYKAQLQAQSKEIEIYRHHNGNLVEMAMALASSRSIQIAVKNSAAAENQPTNNTFYDFSGANFGGGFSSVTQHGQTNTFSLNEKQSLAEAAAEIQKLLDQLAQANPTTTLSEKMAVATKAVGEIENNPTLKMRVMNALREGGTKFIGELATHYLGKILIPILEDWQQSE